MCYTFLESTKTFWFNAAKIRFIASKLPKLSCFQFADLTIFSNFYDFSACENAVLHNFLNFWKTWHFYQTKYHLSVIFGILTSKWDFYEGKQSFWSGFCKKIQLFMCFFGTIWSKWVKIGLNLPFFSPKLGNVYKNISKCLNWGYINLYIFRNYMILWFQPCMTHSPPVEAFFLNPHWKK